MIKLNVLRTALHTHNYYKLLRLSVVKDKDEQRIVIPSCNRMDEKVLSSGLTVCDLIFVIYRDRVCNIYQLLYAVHCTCKGDETRVCPSQLDFCSQADTFLNGWRPFCVNLYPHLML